jgi:hypothetical protein
MPSIIATNQTFDTWTPGTDTAVLTIGTQEPNSLLSNCTINARGAEWGLKMPGNLNSAFTDCRIQGGKERALDIVKGSGSRFWDCQFSAGGDRKPITSKWSLNETCDIGIKGGASDIQFTHCVMTDILLGDHCIYDHPVITPKISGIVLDNCQHPAGKNTPIILRVLNAELPTLVNTNAVALVYWRSVIFTYFWFAGKWIDSRKA